MLFSVTEWQRAPNEVLSKISQLPSTQNFIVRSSCSREDSEETSGAGVFLSIPHVEMEGIPSAVDEVIKSYGNTGDTDAVLVQPMLRGVIRSGVAFSHDLSTASPYRSISWSDGEDTDIVTGGLGGELWQCIKINNNVVIPPPHKMVVDLIEELECSYGQVPIDIEFAFTSLGGNCRRLPSGALAITS